MAPARMISFIEQHVAHCEVCKADRDIQDEIAKITEIILPESKIPKAMRLSSEHDEDDEDLDEEAADLGDEVEGEEEEFVEDLEELDELDEEPLLDDDDEI